MNSGDLQPAAIAPLLESPEPLLSDTAWWIAARHPQWGSVVVAPLKTALTAASAGEREQALLLDRLTKFAAHDGVGGLIAATATGSVAWARSIALRTMAATTTKQLPAPWVAALQQLLEGAGCRGDAAGAGGGSISGRCARLGWCVPANAADAGS